jgi:hypothetical protein
MNNKVRVEHRPTGLIVCTIGEGTEWIAFARNSSGQVRKIAWTAFPSRSEFMTALGLACQKIGEAEREARAAMPIPGSVRRLA